MIKTKFMRITLLSSWVLCTLNFNSFSMTNSVKSWKLRNNAYLTRQKMKKGTINKGVVINAAGRKITENPLIESNSAISEEDVIDLQRPYTTHSIANKDKNPLGDNFSWNKHIPGFSGQSLDESKNVLDFLFRDKYVKRWNNLNSREKYNLSEHSIQTAYVAHLLALIKNEIFKNNRNYKKLDPFYAVTLALYHDILEIYTGDMPTTTKYRVPKLKPTYSEIEDIATGELIELVPSEFRQHYRSIVSPDRNDPHVLIVKEADIISNYIISLKEISLGSRDFVRPSVILKNQIVKLAKTNPEVRRFNNEILSKFENHCFNSSRGERTISR